MTSALSRVVIAGCALAGSLELVSTSAAESLAQFHFVCPWKDAFIRIELDERGRTAKIKSSLGNVPTEGPYPVTFTEDKSKPPNLTKAIFISYDANYIYNFELNFFRLDADSEFMIYLHENTIKRESMTIYPSHVTRCLTYEALELLLAR